MTEHKLAYNKPALHVQQHYARSENTIES